MKTGETGTPCRDERSELGRRRGGHHDPNRQAVIKVGALAGLGFDPPARDRGASLAPRPRRSDLAGSTVAAGTAILHSKEGWWVEADGHAVLIDTTATATAELLADYPTRSDPAERLAAACSAPVEVGGLSLLSPVTAPCRVVGLAVNDRSHAPDSRPDPRRWPPTFVRRTSGSITGPTGSIMCPAHVRLLDHRVGLGLLIGAPIAVGTVIADDELARYVAGLVVVTDVTARDIELLPGGLYESGSYPSFTPVGPRLVLAGAQELGRLNDLRLQSWVNGQPRHNRLAADMIYSPAQALSALARFQELAPGDLVLTATPRPTAPPAPVRPADIAAATRPSHLDWTAILHAQAPNPAYLHDGDIVETHVATDDAELDLGVQRHQVRSTRPGDARQPAEGNVVMSLTSADRGPVVGDEVSAGTG